MFASFVFAALFIATASADHTITLRNNCAWGVGMTVSNYPNNGAAYTGNTSPDIAAGQSVAITVPSGWNGKWSFDMHLGRICDRPPNSGCENNCFGGIAFGEAACSMTEWTFDSSNIGGRTDYDISNIQGYSVPQQILPPSGGEVVTCTSEDCACDQAYRPGDTSGTCGGTGPVDQATREGPSGDYTVVYCP